MAEFNVAPILKGSMTAFDVLHSSGTIFFRTEKSEFLKGGLLFLIKDLDFLFSYSIQNKNLVVQRNNIISVLTLGKAPERTPLGIFMMWSYSKLTLICKYGAGEKDELKSEVPTEPCAPPTSLLIWARTQNLIPVQTYSSEEEFRSKINSCIQSIQDKIVESGAYYQFWNVEYEGKKIKSRTPKKETEIHSTIHCLLSDQALLSSFEIIPEFKTGIGNLDFLILGKSNDGQTFKLCIEFKNAHSPDLIHGVTNQLPDYMRNCKSKYGIYGVLNYAGEWFQPTYYKDDTDLWIKVNGERMSQYDPIQEEIRPIFLKLSKPKSASKKRK